MTSLLEAFGFAERKPSTATFRRGLEAERTRMGALLRL